MYIDKYFFENSGIVVVHPNDNTATLWLKTKDLVEIIKEVCLFYVKNTLK